MKKTTTSLLTVALAGAVSLAATTDTRAASVQVLMNDDYSSGSVAGTGNFYAQNIDDNSHFKNTASGWGISGGTLQNTGDGDNVAVRVPWHEESVWDRLPAKPSTLVLTIH